MKEVIHTKNAPEPIGPYSQAVRYGSTLYMSGQIAMDPATGEMKIADLTAETDLVMQNIGAVLNEAGLNYSNIIKTSIFLRSMRDFPLVNDVYAKFFDSDYPARETVEVAGLPRGVNVEISVIAAYPA